MTNMNANELAQLASETVREYRLAKRAAFDAQYRAFWKCEACGGYIRRWYPSDYDPSDGAPACDRILKTRPPTECVGVGFLTGYETIKVKK